MNISNTQTFLTAQEMIAITRQGEENQKNKAFQRVYDSIKNTANEGYDNITCVVENKFLYYIVSTLRELNYEVTATFAEDPEPLLYISWHKNT